MEQVSEGCQKCKAKNYDQCVDMFSKGWCVKYNPYYAEWMSSDKNISFEEYERKRKSKKKCERCKEEVEKTKQCFVCKKQVCRDCEPSHRAGVCQVCYDDDGNDFYDYDFIY